MFILVIDKHADIRLGSEFALHLSNIGNRSHARW
jgi:hypothetical protein